MGVSRTQIWNAVQQAQSEGVRLFSVRGRGYQLPEPIEWLDTDAVRAHLVTPVRVTLEIAESLDSTNTALMQRATMSELHAHCLAAEWQAGGRGRRGRDWQGAVGGALMFSLAWRFQCGASGLSGLSLAVGVALARAISEAGIEGIQLKWPNDLMHGYRKLGGILIELQGDALGPTTAIIGIGLNLRLPAAVRERINQAVVDVHELATPVSRNALLGRLLTHLADMLVRFERDGFAPIRQEWEILHAYHGRSINLLMPGGLSESGVVKGIAADGSLVVDTPAGVRHFGSGEISLRPADSAKGRRA